MAELAYVQEERASDLSLLGTGSVLNLYLKGKKSSQINVLVGFLPNSNQVAGQKKLLLTADANILLRNSFGAGETIGLVWQQLQQKSPRLNLLYEQPYIFHSSFGLNFSLDMYRRDSTFLNLNMNLGTSYKIREKQTASIFLQRRQTIVSDVNTALVLLTHQLPRDADVSSLNLGAGYGYNSTNYKLNPRKGNELTVTATAGTKKIRKNQQILELEDPNNPSFKFEQLYDTVKQNVYQFRVNAYAAHYLPVGKQSTLKMGVNAGLYQSASYFRNELFQIGGYRLLRGFDEESQFVSRYGIGTLEYRYLIGINSAFFAFVDGGWGSNVLEQPAQHTYIGTGLGLSFETRAGIFNLAWAVGKRNDLEFNLRQSKVHLGFASYF
jgi:outer membrane protein assembly factor BamA